MKPVAEPPLRNELVDADPYTPAVPDVEVSSSKPTAWLHHKCHWEPIRTTICLSWNTSACFYLFFYLSVWKLFHPTKLVAWLYFYALSLINLHLILFMSMALRTKSVAPCLQKNYSLNLQVPWVILANGVTAESSNSKLCGLTVNPWNVFYLFRENRQKSIPVSHQWAKQALCPNKTTPYFW